LHPVLEVFKPVIEDLQKALGPNSEVVLHDLSQPQSSIVAIAGNITMRKIGGPITNFVLRLLQQNLTETHHINYSNITPDGKVLRSSTLFLKDEVGKTVGCLCINFDLTYILPFHYWLDNYCSANNGENFEKPIETFTLNIEDMVQEAVNKVTMKLEKPIALMTRDDRIKAIKMLDEQGIFLLKNSVQNLAKIFGISRASLYNYLNLARMVSVGKDDGQYP